MKLAFIFVIVKLALVNSEDSSQENNEKFVDLLPEQEKREFIQKVSKRIFEEVKAKGNSGFQSGEIPPDEVDKHSEYVSKVFKEETNILRQNTNDSNSEKSVGSDSDSSNEVGRRDGSSLNVVALKQNEATTTDNSETEETSTVNDKVSINYKQSTPPAKESHENKNTNQFDSQARSGEKPSRHYVKKHVDARPNKAAVDLTVRTKNNNQKYKNRSVGGSAKNNNNIGHDKNTVSSRSSEADSNESGSRNNQYIPVEVIVDDPNHDDTKPQNNYGTGTNTKSSEHVKRDVTTAKHHQIRSTSITDFSPEVRSSESCDRDNPTCVRSGKHGSKTNDPVNENSTAHLESSTQKAAVINSNKTQTVEFGDTTSESIESTSITVKVIIAEITKQHDTTTEQASTESYVTIDKEIPKNSDPIQNSTSTTTTTKLSTTESTTSSTTPKNIEIKTTTVKVPLTTNAMLTTSRPYLLEVSKSSLLDIIDPRIVAKINSNKEKVTIQSDLTIKSSENITFDSHKNEDVESLGKDLSGKNYNMSLRQGPLEMTDESRLDTTRQLIEMISKFAGDNKGYAVYEVPKGMSPFIKVNNKEPYTIQKYKILSPLPIPDEKPKKGTKTVKQESIEKSEFSYSSFDSKTAKKTADTENLNLVHVYNYDPANAYFNPRNHFAPNVVSGMKNSVKINDYEVSDKELSASSEIDHLRGEDGEEDYSKRNKLDLHEKKKKLHHIKDTFPKIPEVLSKVTSRPNGEATYFINPGKTILRGGKSPKLNKTSVKDIFDSVEWEYVVKDIKLLDTDDEDHPYNAIQKGEIKDIKSYISKILVKNQVYERVPHATRKPNDPPPFIMPYERLKPPIIDAIKKKLALKTYLVRPKKTGFSWRKRNIKCRSCLGNQSNHEHLMKLLSYDYVSSPEYDYESQDSQKITRAHLKRLLAILGARDSVPRMLAVQKHFARETPHASIEDEVLNPYVEVMGDLIKMDSKALHEYNWHESTVNILSAVRKLDSIIEKYKAGEVIDPADLMLLKIVVMLHKKCLEMISSYKEKPSRKNEDYSIDPDSLEIVAESLETPITSNERKNTPNDAQSAILTALRTNKQDGVKKRYSVAGDMEEARIHIGFENVERSRILPLTKQQKQRRKHRNRRKKPELNERLWLFGRSSRVSFRDCLYLFKEFLDELEDDLSDLHKALKQISMVTNYKNQNWFPNLRDVFLRDPTKKNILEVLLHIITSRAFDLLEQVVYDLTNELRSKDRKGEDIILARDEMIFAMRIVRELDRINGI